jgi:integrase
MLHDITSEMVEEFTQSRLKEVGPSCVNGSLRVLRRALRLAEEWKLIGRAPRFALLPNEHSREFIISEELLQKMLAHKDCNALLKKMLPFLIDTGLRVTEALALRWDTVGLEPKQGSSLGWVYVEKGKSKFAKRHVPLTVRARQILSDIKETSTSNFVFPAQDGGLLTRHVPSQQFHTLREAMRLPKDCVLHSTRHSFCSRLGLAGVDSYTLQRLAGHSSIVISQKYVHPTGLQMEAAISKL